MTAESFIRTPLRFALTMVLIAFPTMTALVVFVLAALEHLAS